MRVVPDPTLGWESRFNPDRWARTSRSSTSAPVIPLSFPLPRPRGRWDTDLVPPVPVGRNDLGTTGEEGVVVLTSPSGFPLRQYPGPQSPTPTVTTPDLTYHYDHKEEGPSYYRTPFSIQDDGPVNRRRKSFFIQND